MLLILLFVVAVKVTQARRSRKEHLGGRDVEPKFTVPYDSVDSDRERGRDGPGPTVPGLRYQHESCPPRLPKVRVPGEIRAWELYGRR